MTTQYLQFFAWNEHSDKSEVANLLANNKPQIIEYISPEEWYPSNSITDILYEYAENNECELRILLNSYNKWNNQHVQPVRKNVTYEDNPTLILYYILINYHSSICDNYNFSKGNNVHEFDSTDRVKRVKYNVISMTNKVQDWRCEMIDRFQQYGIINNNNCIIWQNNGVSDYDYKFFKPKSIIKEKFIDNNGVFNSFNLPADYSISWFAAAAESSVEVITITEKAATPMLFMKPFLILGCKGYHRFLESIGFKLFDEFIDYSFDLENNLTRRIDLFAQQIEKISNLSKNDIIGLNHQIKDKLIHNKKMLFKLFHSPSFEPKYTTAWKILGQRQHHIYDKEINAQINWYQHARARGWYDNI